MSGYETIVTLVLARLLVPDVDWPTNVRRAHLTAVPGDAESAIHLVDGSDAPVTNDRLGNRVCDFTVSVFVRSDAGVAAVDPIKLEVNRRLNPATEPYPDGILVRPDAITVNTEVADTDVTRVDMKFTVRYGGGEGCDEWAL